MHTSPKENIPTPSLRMENVKLLRGETSKIYLNLHTESVCNFPWLQKYASWGLQWENPTLHLPPPFYPFLSSVSDRKRAEPSSWSGRKSGFPKLRWTRVLRILPQLNSKAAPLHKLRIASILKVHARKGLSF